MKTRNWISLAASCLTVSMVGAGLSGEEARAATVNLDSSYSKWPKGVVPYCIDSIYGVPEVQLIKTAIQKIMSDAPFVRFEQVLCSDDKYKIRITPLVPGTTSPQPYSWSYPGVSVSLVEKGAKEQVVSFVREQGAPYSLRQAIKTLVTVLGLRNEHQRQDRDEHLTLYPDNIAVAGAYTKYTSGQAHNVTEFDYCSITLNQPGDYAKANTKAFDLAKAPADGGGSMWRPELSKLDVETLAKVFGVTGFKSSKQCCLALVSCQKSLGG